MASDNAVNAKITADASGFRRGAQEAESGLDRLAAKLREHRAEEVQQSRATRFFAQEIANLGIVSGQAGEALSALVGAFAAGSGIGAAAETVKLLAHAFVAAREESKKFAEETAKDLRALQKQTDDYVESLKGEVASQKMARELIEPLDQKAVQQKEELRNKTDALAAAQDKLNRAMSSGAGGAIATMKALVIARQRQLEDAQKELDKTEIAIAAKGVQVGRAGSGEDNERLRKLLYGSEGKMHELQVGEAQRKADDLAQDRQYYEKKTAEVTAFVSDKLEKELQVEIAEAQFRADSLNEDHKYYERKTAETTQALDKQFALEEEQSKRLAHELGSAAKDIGRAFGENIAGMIQGTESLDDVLHNMLKTMLQAAAQLALMSAIASGNPFAIIGAGVLEGIAPIVGSLGDGGGRSSNINVTQNFHGGATPGSSSLEFQRVMVSTIRDLQRRGRL